jgi:plasmid replication initiation protein
LTSSIYKGVEVAELTNLESKLGEVVGLAMAAQAATKKVATLARADKRSGLVAVLEKMNAEAKEAAERGQAVADTFEGKKSAILDEARTSVRCRFWIGKPHAVSSLMPE